LSPATVWEKLISIETIKLTICTCHDFNKSFLLHSTIAPDLKTFTILTQINIKLRLTWLY